jgi:hypothetical protein
VIWYTQTPGATSTASEYAPRICLPWRQRLLGLGSQMTRTITATLAVASSMVQLRRAPKTAQKWAEPFRVGLLLEGNFGLPWFFGTRYELLGDRSRFRGGLSEPGFEARLTESRAIAGKESALAQLYAVVASVWVCDNFSRILVCG